MNHVGGVMVNVWSVVDHGFESKDFKIGICCFSAKHTALRKKSKDRLAWNQDNVSKWPTCLTTYVLVLYKADFTTISLKINLFSPWYSWNIAELVLNNNHSLTHLFNFSFLLICEI